MKSESESLGFRIRSPPPPPGFPRYRPLSPILLLCRVSLIPPITNRERSRLAGDARAAFTSFVPSFLPALSSALSRGGASRSKRCSHLGEIRGTRTMKKA